MSEIQPAPRIGDAERDEAVTCLQTHLSEGRLDGGEFDERMGAALQARTASDLTDLFTDLPDPRPAALGGRPAAGLPATTARAAAPERRSHVVRTFGIVNAVAWPLTIVACFALGWSHWWLMLIPCLVVPAIGNALGVWRGDDAGHSHDDHDAERQERRAARAERRGRA